MKNWKLKIVSLKKRLKSLLKVGQENKKLLTKRHLEMQVRITKAQSRCKLILVSQLVNAKTFFRKFKIILIKNTMMKMLSGTRMTLVLLKIKDRQELKQTSYGLWLTRIVLQDLLLQLKNLLQFTARKKDDCLIIYYLSRN